MHRAEDKAKKHLKTLSVILNHHCVLNVRLLLKKKNAVGSITVMDV